jgi:hypothetical protein
MFAKNSVKKQLRWFSQIGLTFSTQIRCNSLTTVSNFEARFESQSREKRSWLQSLKADITELLQLLLFLKREQKN